MSTPEMTLSRFLSEVYCLNHEIGRETQRQYEIAVRLFERWSGGPVALSALDPLKVSEWLRELSATRAPSTVRAKRVQVMALWRAAADEGLCLPPSRRVRSVRVPWKPPVAWTHEEVGHLAIAARRLKRRHACGLRRAVWWELAVRFAWDTGLRWGDMIGVRVDQITADGLVVLAQGKTGCPAICRLAPSTLALAKASVASCPRGLLLPWPHSHESFARQLRGLVRAACIRSGTWKWIRRGGSTDCEIVEKGAATPHLGHRPGSKLAGLNYVDPIVLGVARTMPRELVN